MAKKTTLIKWTVVLLAICVFLLIAVVLLLTPKNKSQPQVDYIAEYNRINKPADFDPNDNAALYFDKAFAVMAEAPNDVKAIYNRWPADMNNEQLQKAKQWVESNRQTLDYLKQAVQKPYYWKPLNAENDEPLMMADMNDLAKFRKAAHLLCLEAKFMAQSGQIEPALRQLTDVYKMGTFLTGPKFLVYQLVGIAESATAVRSAFLILDHTNPSPAVLEDFQKSITSLSREKPFLMDFTSERLIFYYGVERQSAGSRCLKFADTPYLYFKMLFFSTVGRPWLEREKRKADLMYDYFDAARLKTPWQLHKEGVNLDDMAAETVKGSLLLSILTPAVSRTILYSYRLVVQTDALIATTAILRYKADKGHLPQDLQTLVTDGYLDKLPMDVFSDGPLVYKLSDDNFILYSFAMDFDDDGGKHDYKWADKSYGDGNGDFVFWPVQPAVSPSNPYP
jgi:hypothetical protein